MIRLGVSIIFSLASFFVQSQSVTADDSCSLLWSVSGNGLLHTSYLFGTMHIDDDRLRAFDENWRKAFESAGIVAGETDFNSGSSDMMTLLQSLRADTTIDKVLQPDKVDVIEKYLADRLGPDMAPILMRIQPFFLMVLLMELPDDVSRVNEIMDVYLMNLAMQRGKRVVGLETTSEQLEVVSGISVYYQAEMLYEFVAMASNGHWSDFWMGSTDAELIQTYLHQCIDAFMTLNAKMDLNEQLVTQIVPRRNVRFANRLEPLMRENAVFCAVGAMHLPGDDGMIALLRARGYKVFPVKFDFLKK